MNALSPDLMSAIGTSALIALATLLVVAAISDIRARRIPNALCLAIAALSPVYWWAQPVAFVPTLAFQAALALVILIVFGLFWTLGWLGGGDVKLKVATALWLPLAPLMNMLLWMAMAGATLSLVVWAAHKRWPERTDKRVPYGVAIAFGGLAVVGKPILNALSAITAGPGATGL
ncbi:MAG: prepilin peptidase [Pacificimonas sp.]